MLVRLGGQRRSSAAAEESGGDLQGRVATGADRESATQRGKGPGTGALSRVPCPVGLGRHQLGSNARTPADSEGLAEAAERRSEHPRRLCQWPKIPLRGGSAWDDPPSWENYEVNTSGTTAVGSVVSPQDRCMGFQKQCTVQQRRAEYNSVKRKLRDLEIPYSMLFPARLRVVAPTGAESFSTPEEAWAWLESCSAPDPQYRKKRQRPRLRRRQTAHRIDPPTPKEVQEERQRVMEAVVLFGGGPGGSATASPSSPQKEDGHSDSDNETATSTQSSIVLPAITPGTAEEII
ncbi:hypothetical protein NDU88_003348 [Pleurodeles waltl]|uniref:Uncharacterized protein n=1 Tax=Pleurodeles waltl TaxID=8319 RepID=A0AAV7Q9I5_PLEWA|nr:hypothetical protein NDU88_003348 [Pleurodeles waltl]